MKWTITKKLGGFCLLMVASLTILGTFSYRNIRKSIENTELVRHTFKVIEENGNIPSYTWEAESALRGLFLTGNQIYYQQYQVAVQNIAKSSAELNKTIRDEKARQVMRQLDVLINNRFKAFEDILQAYRELKIQGAIQFIKSGTSIKLSAEIIKCNMDLDKLERELLKEHEKELEISNSNLRSLVMLGIPLALLLIVLSGYYITRGITQPLNQLSQVAEGISRGDLSRRPIVEERGDEVGILAGSFARMYDYLHGMSRIAQSLAENDLSVACAPLSSQDSLGNAFAAMIANLRAMALEIQDAALLISSSATQIAAMSSQLAASSAETAAAVNETSTTVEEIKVTAQLVSQKTVFVSESAQNTAQMSLSGRKSVDETMNGMDKIRHQMDYVAESIVKLSEQSMAIGEIIASVNDLASQSNLLAVNASIEAAKAGEQGKGFAVVAQEVRSLAEQSKSATEQIRRILNDIQKAISSAVMATEQGGKAVEVGVRQTTESANAIQTIEEGAAGTVQAAAQIKASTNEQVAGLNQVALAMENVRNASDQIVLGTRQAEASTSALNEMGKKLREVVQRFKVN